MSTTGKSRPLVSIIIPAYNSEKYIGETIQSVLAQTFTNYELIILNDGSTDSTGDVVSQFDDSRIQYSEHTNIGMAATRNVGISKAQGKYFAFLDNDDLWEPENLALKVNFLDANSDIEMVHSDGQQIDGSSAKQEIYHRGKEGRLLKDLLDWNGEVVPAPSSILVTAALTNKINGFDADQSIHADKDFYYRVANKTEIGRIPKTTWYYRVHGENYSRNIEVMEADCILSYQKCTELNLFESEQHRRDCYATMHYILAGSWYSVKRDYAKTFQNLGKAIQYRPSLIFDLLKKPFA